MRWVATDESGWDGEQLYRRADPYLSIGSVAIDDETAAPIVDNPLAPWAGLAVECAWAAAALALAFLLLRRRDA